jgi:chromosome segregation ATPase
MTDVVIDELRAQLAQAQAEAKALTSQLGETKGILKAEQDRRAQVQGELDAVKQELGQVARKCLGQEVALRDQAALIRALEARVAALVAWRAKARAAISAPVEAEDKPA